mgnify:CR=1 FL=1
MKMGDLVRIIRKDKNYHHLGVVMEVRQLEFYHETLDFLYLVVLNNGSDVIVRSYDVEILQ